MGQIMPINKLQFFRHVHISVEIDITVGGMIIGTVEFQEFLIGQFRDHIRISAGFKSIRRIRKKRIHDLSLQNLVR